MSFEKDRLYNLTHEDWRKRYYAKRSYWQIFVEWFKRLICG